MNTQESILKTIEDKREQYIHAALDIWDYAEPIFEEYKSSARLSALLEQEGFSVTKGVAGLPTAFIASWGEGKPVIGFMGEFDALPNLSQKADSVEREPIIEGGHGHGCGHHTLGTAAVAAAIAVKDYLKENGISRSYAGENGFARVMIVDGDRVFKGSNKGGVIQKHPIRLEKEDLEYADGFDLIHTTNNGFTDDLLPDLHVLSPFVSYDFSYRWNEEDRVDRVCPHIDFAFLSCSDLSDEATEGLCGKLHEKGCGVVTATRGSKGATVYDGHHFYRQLPDYVIPVDTMGAGDSFATAMLVTILKKLEEESEANWEDPEIRMKILPVALKTAAAFSAKTCLIKGAFGGGVQVPDSVYEQVYKDL